MHGELTQLLEWVWRIGGTGGVIVIGKALWGLKKLHDAEVAEIRSECKARCAEFAEELREEATNASKLGSAYAQGCQQLTNQQLQQLREKLVEISAEISGLRGAIDRRRNH